MKYHPIDRNLYIKNRAKFTAQMKPKSVAVFNSNDIYPISADSTMPFAQHRDIFYLSGVDQEESVLVLFPDCPKAKHREILFLKETNEHIAIWEGEKLNKQQATTVSGIEHVYWFQDFEKIMKPFFFQAEHIYLNLNEHTRRYIDAETAEMRFNQAILKKYPLHKFERSAPIMHKIRAIKSTQEIERKDTTTKKDTKAIKEKKTILALCWLTTN